MSSTSQDLARHEARAEHGIIEFAEEMQVIRDRNLYPGAPQEGQRGEVDAWKTYCKGRWGLSHGRVDGIIRATPVLRRRSQVQDSSTSVEKAIAVATLPVAVQDAILGEDASDIHEDDVKAKAKAARKAKRDAENEGREATVEELIDAAANVKAKKPTKKKHKSRFTSLLAQATAFAEDAADYAQSNVLSDIENEYGWSRVEKLRYHADRIAEALTRPEHIRDMDEEFAELLTEGE